VENEYHFGNIHLYKNQVEGIGGTTHLDFTIDCLLKKKKLFFFREVSIQPHH
jgi:hypothetical protein